MSCLRGRDKEKQGGRERKTLFEQALEFVCSLMQKWTSANADWPRIKNIAWTFLCNFSALVLSGRRAWVIISHVTSLLCSVLTNYLLWKINPCISVLYFSYRVSKDRFVQNITFSWYYWKSTQMLDSRSGIFRFTLRCVQWLWHRKVINMLIRWGKVHLNEL